MAVHLNQVSGLVTQTIVWIVYDNQRRSYRFCKRYNLKNLRLNNSGLKEDRGPLDLTRRIDELEAENKTLKARLDKLQKIMFDQFRNKGAL